MNYRLKDKGLQVQLDAISDGDFSRQLEANRGAVVMGIETKAPGKAKNTTPNQKRHLENIHVAGGVAVVAADSQVVEDALTRLQQYGECIYSVP